VKLDQNECSSSKGTSGRLRHEQRFTKTGDWGYPFESEGRPFKSRRGSKVSKEFQHMSCWSPFLVCFKNLFENNFTPSGFLAQLVRVPEIRH
jgi:hypothetical protein